MSTNTLLTRLQATKLLARLSLPDTSLINRLKFFFRPLILPITQLFSLLPDGESVFDIGCGQGQLLALIAQTKNPSRILGVEIDRQLVANANYVLSKLNRGVVAPVQVFNGRDLPSEADRFTHWMLVDVLHHIPLQKRLAFFTSLRKNMTSKNILIVKDIDASRRFLTLFNRLHDRVLSGSAGEEATVSEFADLMSKSGFRVSQITHSRVLWYPHFIAVCNPV